MLGVFAVMLTAVIIICIILFIIGSILSLFMPLFMLLAAIFSTVIFAVKIIRSGRKTQKTPVPRPPSRIDIKH